LERILSGEFKRKVQVKEVELSTEGKMFVGRQVVFMMHDFFRITEVDSAMQDWDELIHVELKGDNLQQFYNDWDTACLNVRDLPDERIMETLYRKQLSKSESFKNTFALYNQDVAQARDRPDYTKLKNLLRLQLENPRLGRNKNALDRSRTSPTLTPA